ncbi:MAG TPA: transferrin-binding protein-like solute binding protein [Sphingomonadaceae bacterium]|nr:transferrin-binding protein-like solute binding protein [Sphingomonadaceae bacterium]
MKRSFEYSLAACCISFFALALAGCGGGGGVNSTPTPTPPPTNPPASEPPPTPTPSDPTPPEPRPTFPLSKAGTLPGFISLVGYTGKLGSGINDVSNASFTEFGVYGLPGKMSVQYNPLQKTYTVQDTSVSATFGLGDKIDSVGYEHRFQTSDTGSSDSLSLYGNAIFPAPNGEAPVKLSYTSYARWSHTDTALDHTTISYAVFGLITPEADIPRAGKSSFTGTVVGDMYEFDHIKPRTRSLSGDATFSADFAAGTVSTLLNLNARGASFTGEGTISASEFGGLFVSSNRRNFEGGQFKGAFFGPAADEFGYSFFISEYNPDPYAGASVAPMKTWYSGVVVGKAD